MAKKPQPAVTPVEYDLVIDPIGYFNKREITNQDARALVKGSKNIIINDGDKVASRKGYTLDGAARTVTTGIDGHFDFASRNGKKILRAFQGATTGTGKLQVRTEYTTGTPVWADLITGLTYTEYNFATWWYATENVRVLLFVDGTTSLRMWGGGLAYIASNTATTLTKSGTETWAQAGFFISLAGRTVTIPGYGTFTYTGGETTTTLTGLTALPAIPVGTPAFQGVVTTTSLTGVTAGTVYDLIMTKDNHVILGSTLSSVLYGSKITDYLDYGFTTPVRTPGDGFKITVDNYSVGLTQDSDSVYLFAGFDDLYQIKFILTSDGTGESITVTKLRSGAGQAAISQSAIIPVKNGIMYITQEKTLTWLTSIQNIVTPQSLPVSDPIKADFDELDLTGASGTFFENEMWLALPAENLTYIYSFDKGLWQAPQTLPLSGFSIIANSTTGMNELYGHSNTSDETYKLNDGLTDNGVTIEFVAAFAYRQYGNRGILHGFDEYFTELYMSIPTTVVATHRYEYLGSDLIVVKNIVGTDTELAFSPNIDPSLGKENLGKSPLGSTAEEVPELSKYRHIAEMKLVDFFEHQVIYSCDSVDGQFEIIAHGPNVRPSTNYPRSIKR